ncbi:PA2169 family four-helix-bundle protein [Pseudomonas sichuanensis]|uniref:ferritin-like domain-containing protein n=1 Tax=Pseudomonas TaxID=286 RepID=UPI00129B3A96|nr:MULTISPECIES: PA2169 family four-helix-bundle protein [Pseudomonas]MDH0729978.1 PA2169 family four-helix-bundle protein [Pseudomonas sichuanensis]MDH1584554.1 PA2169 family four-helix-bundle protein [Pseudomonas sichuanensis]MDH1593683.1 PA2169 family four-helix-bundle protein [Pseudomonas sichuanensis]MDH1600686.1 PA2169 family four-helix-bundle protein [Pseudomonas sichuanensis]MDU9405277.1 PA2169 family four-helix-bundle protein [Pseudomonas sp. zfem004]
MSNPNKDVIDVLNDLIEYSKDGEKGFKTSAEDVKNPQLKAFFVQRAGECANAAAQLQSEVRRLGGDPETSTSISGDLHRGWVNLKSLVTGKDETAVLNEVERGEDHALKAYKDAREKLVKLGRTTSDQTYMLVENQLQGVQRNHDQVKALRNAARAAS